MRRMYGDQRQGELLTQEVVYERRRFDRSLRSGRLLQILNVHNVRDLQNLDDLRLLADRTNGLHQGGEVFQRIPLPKQPEPKRSVRYNSRWVLIPGKNRCVNACDEQSYANAYMLASGPMPAAVETTEVNVVPY